MLNATKYNESLFRQAIEFECSHINVAALVDIGSGDGRHTSKLAKLCQAKKIICVDHDPKILLKAKRREFEIIQADLNQKIPLKTNTADLVIVDQVIEHIAKTDLLAAEVYRILKPGGKAIWSTPNLASWHNIMALMFGYQPFSSQISDQAFLGNPWHPLNHQPIHEAQAHLRLFTKYSLKDLLEHHQFIIDKVITVGYYPFNSKLATWMAAIDPIHAAYLLFVTRKIITEVQ